MKRRPVAGQLAHDRLLRHALARLLRGVELGLELLDKRLRIDSRTLRIRDVQQRAVFDLAVAGSAA